jgi:hypothetical protein
MLDWVVSVHNYERQKRATINFATSSLKRLNEVSWADRLAQ